MRNRVAMKGIRMGGVLVLSVTTALLACGQASAATASLKELTPSSAQKVITQKLGPLKIATGNTTRGVSGKTITISGVASVTESGVAAIPGVCDGAKAAFAASNKSGGVNGYKINYLGCKDDGFNPTVSNQLTSTAILQNRVFALVPWMGAGSATVLNKNHVPYFGLGSNTGAYCGWNGTQFGFSVTSAEGCVGSVGGSSIFSGLGVQAYLEALKIQPNKVKLALISQNDHTSEVSNNALALIAKSLGEKVVYNQAPIPDQTSPPLTDYSGIIHQLVASGANLIIDTAAGASVLSISGGLKLTGYRGNFQQFTFSDASFLAVPSVAQAMNGAYAGTPQVGSIAFPSATTRQIQADLAAVGAPTNLTLGSLTSFGSAELFLAALKKVKGTLTTEKLAAVLNDGFTFPGVGNAVCPSTWPAAHVAASDCGAYLRLNGITKSVDPVLNLGIHGNSYFISG